MSDWSLPSLGDLALMVGVAAGALVVGSAFSAIWAGVNLLQARQAQKRDQVHVVTCPVTGEGALLHIENSQVTECSLHGTFCGEICQRKSSTGPRGNFDTSKLLKIQ